MHNETIYLFQDLTLKAFLETQDFIKNVDLDFTIKNEETVMSDKISFWRKRLVSELHKIFDNLKSGHNSEEVNEFFENIDFNEVYDKFLQYFDKEVEDYK